MPIDSGHIPAETIDTGYQPLAEYLRLMINLFFQK
jgi:hypothetical protein